MHSASLVPSPSMWNSRGSPADSHQHAILARQSYALKHNRDYSGLGSVVEVSAEGTGMPRYLAWNWQAIFVAARQHRLSNANVPMPGVWHRSVLVPA